MFLDSPTWTADFRNHLASAGLGTVADGYAVPAGSDQFFTLPWAGVDRVRVRFTKDVSVQREDLRLHGLNVPTYRFSGFAYDATTYTATWVLPTPLAADKLLLSLDGSPVSPGAVADPAGDRLDGEFPPDGTGTFPSGDGIAGGNFDLRVDALPGDADHDGAVGQGDADEIAARLGTSPASPGTDPDTYDIFHDVDGSGAIAAAADSAAVATFTGTALPDGDPADPRVVGVLVDSSAWDATFRNGLAARGLGDGGGFAVPAGADQLKPLPWTNLDRIKVRFSEDVAVPPSALTITGAGGAVYVVRDFAYDPATFTAAWTLPVALDRDTIKLALKGFAADGGVADAGGNDLDGEWVDGGSGAFPSGDTVAGGDFEFTLAVLPGDANGSGAVDAADTTAVRNRGGTSASSPGGPPYPYTPFHDVDGSGGITAGDLVRTRNRVPPAAPAPSPTTPPRTRPA